MLVTQEDIDFFETQLANETNPTTIELLTIQLKALKKWREEDLAKDRYDESMKIIKLNK